MKTVQKDIETFGNMKDNIIQNINYAFPDFHSLKELGVKFYISGGYALSLLAAPRVNVQNQTGDFHEICRSYYNDIDCYFETEIDYKIADAFFKGKGYSNSFSNDKCKSYICSNNQEIQLVKAFFGSPEQIFESFDIVNCCIAISPDYKIHTHRNFYKSVFRKEIDVNTLKLDKSYEDLKMYLSVILNRLSKYCYRYNFTVSDSYLKVLKELKEIYPVISINQNRRYGTGSGSKLILTTVNLWEETRIKDLFNETSTDIIDNPF